MKDSMIIYRSFVSAGKKIKNKNQRLAYYEAIFDFGLDQIEPNLDDVADAIFDVIKPQIEANNKRYSNGSKGGRKKKNQTETKTKPNGNQNDTKVEPNVNDNVNDNENVNDNDNVNVIGLFEDELGRPLSSYEMQMILELENVHTSALLKFALKESVRQGKRTLKYIEGILNNWKSQGVKSVQDAEMVMDNFKNNGKKQIVQNWGGTEDNVSEDERENLIREMESWG